MVKATGVAISPAVLTALYYINEYRYLTIEQISKIIKLKPKSVSALLLRLERQKLLGFFGNTGIRGYGKTPKVYFLTKTGHRILNEEAEFVGLPAKPYRPVNISSRWSPKMYHRLATLDVLISLEVATQELQLYTTPAIFTEYRREKIKGKWWGETTDFVELPAISQNRIIPDAGFVLENCDNKRRALFLIEVDRGTETHISQSAENIHQSFHHKITQYQRYLSGKRFAKRYSQWGEFAYFVLLVITTTSGRVANMREALSDLDANLHQYFRFSTQQQVLAHFFHQQWKGRSIDDQNNYAIIKGST